ncbi:alpha/beta-hydrolase [Periconia macrospinosa]|uniref:Alpha/beta-hydrolase n=1 Tax=Periconia macrospinosa TaxID=97972 RepID=A0A2V1E2T9_9PLEO|nr:alpha/beta-hydrolase [Periconia macrospinosa]
MASSTKPALVFVTGSFVMASHYDPLIDAIKAKGYTAQIVQLQTAGKRPGPLPTMYDDAAAINATTTKLAEEGRDVVVIAHSYGGVPSTQSLKGVTKAEREKEGKKGGVVSINYIAALVPELGASAGSTFEGNGAPVGYTVPDEDGWLYHVDKELTIPIVFNMSTREQGLKYFEDFVQHSSVSFGNELTHAGYADVPTSWFFPEKDNCVVPAVQEKGIENIEKASGRKVDVTRNPTDHCPETSALEDLINWIVKVLEKGGQE